MPDRTRAIDDVTLREFLIKDAERLRRYMTSKIPPELRSLTSSEDILQEVWVAAFRRRARFRADGPDALARWVTTLANRRLVDTFRAARALKRCGPIPDLRVPRHRESSVLDLFDRFAPSKHTPSSETSAKEAAQAVRLALSALPEDQRRAIWMHHVDGRSVADIAGELQKSASAVYSLLFRARRKLCVCLGRASKFFSDQTPSAKRTG